MDIEVPAAGHGVVRAAGRRDVDGHDGRRGKGEGGEGGHGHGAGDRVVPVRGWW